MKLLESWAESLALIMPRQAKVIALVTLKVMSDLLYNPFTLLVIVPLSMTISFNMAYAYQPAYEGLRVISSLISNIFVVLMILYVRPSILLKHRFYFMNYWRHIVYIAVFYGLFSFIHYQVAWQIPDYLWLIWAPLSTFWILFFVDSHASIDGLVRSFIHAFKMVVYNLPLALIVTALWYFCFALLVILPVQIITTLFAMQAQFWFFVVGSLVGIILFPLWYCLLSNIYIKRLHDQFTIYFGDPLN